MTEKNMLYLVSECPKCGPLGEMDIINQMEKVELHHIDGSISFEDKSYAYCKKCGGLVCDIPYKITGD
jgi:uncharacterized Zn finger protein